MRYLKRYKLFENLEDKIDLDELEDYLIDFKQMSLNWDVNIGSSHIIDWDKVNKQIENDVIRQCYLHSGEISDYSERIGEGTINIDFKVGNLYPMRIDFNDLLDGYNMISDYLNDKYSLKSNYIFINMHWNYLYFENFEAIKIWAYGGKYKGTYFSGRYKKGEKIELNRITFGFK